MSGEEVGLRCASISSTGLHPERASRTRASVRAVRLVLVGFFGRRPCWVVRTTPRHAPISPVGGGRPWPPSAWPGTEPWRRRWRQGQAKRAHLHVQRQNEGGRSSTPDDPSSQQSVAPPPARERLYRNASCPDLPGKEYAIPESQWPGFLTTLKRTFPTRGRGAHRSSHAGRRPCSTRWRSSMTTSGQSPGCWRRCGRASTSTRSRRSSRRETRHSRI